MAIGMQLQAQWVTPPYFYLGVKGGAVATDMVLTQADYDVYAHQPLIDWHGGLFVKWRPLQRLSLMLEVQSLAAGAGLSWADVDYTMRARQLDVRLLPAFQFGQRGGRTSPYLAIGPFLSFPTGGEIEYVSDYTPQLLTPLTTANYAGHEYGLYAGIGFDWLFEFGYSELMASLEAGVRWGLSSTFAAGDMNESSIILNPETDAPLYTMQRLNRGVEVALRIGIPLKKKAPLQPREVVYYFDPEDDDEPQVVEVEKPLRKVTAEGCLTLGEIRDLANDGVDIRGMRICLFNILFDFDKYDIRPEAEFIISDLSALLRQYPDLRIKVSGHTDSRGSDEYNQTLSERRARAVKYAIISHGILGSRIEWEGYGESRPIDANDTDAGRARNRRVEIEFK